MTMVVGSRGIHARLLLFIIYALPFLPISAVILLLSG